MAWFYDDKPLWEKTQELTDRCKSLQDTKADNGPIWGEVKTLRDTDTDTREWLDKLRGEHDGLAHQFAEARAQLTGELAALDEHLKHGIPDELRKLCDQQLTTIDERLQTLAQLEQQTRGASLTCEAICEKLKDLDSKLRESSQRAGTEAADHVAAAKGEAEKARSSAQEAGQLIDHHRHATATFLVRLRWLFGGATS